jgi:hypothetical protein
MVTMLCSVRETYGLLTERHYLGPTKAAGFAWLDQFGCIVFAAPRARGVPHRWLEVVRWCLTGEKNGGSRQWSAAVAMIRKQRPDCTTIVSYSDPSQGHTGALYRACNWLWAPTWHRLRPPPTGNGAWTEEDRQAVKDRWVYPLKHDPKRCDVLTVKDDALMRKFPWASFREPAWHQGRFDPRERAAAFKTFNASRDCAIGAAPVAQAVNTQSGSQSGVVRRDEE